MRPQFSKIIVLITTIQLISAIIYACLFGNESNYILIAAIIGALASVNLTTIGFYMRNSWVEKIVREKTEIVKVTAQERLNYNKEMMLFMKKNGFTKEQLEEIEADSPMDEIDQSAIDNLTSSIDDAMDSASEPPEVEIIDV